MFLIQQIFDVQHGLLATKFYNISLKLKGKKNKQIYYNSSTVLYDGGELFYKSILVLTDKVSLYCSEDVVVKLLESRIILN